MPRNQGEGIRAPSTLAVLKRVTEDTPRPIQEIIPEVPDWLVAVISKLHSKRPEERYQTATEVANLLASCQSELQHTGKVTSIQSSHHAPRDEPPSAAQPSTSRPSPSHLTSLSAVVPPNAVPQGSSRRSETATLNRTRRLAAAAVVLILVTAIVARRGNDTKSEISNSKS